MTSPRKSFTFFFPYREISGVPLLFRRMAETLADRFGIQTSVVDYADGAMSRNMTPGSAATVRTFEDGTPFVVPSDTILVLQSILPYTMRPELRIAPSTRIIFWTLHPTNLIQTIIPVPFFRHLQIRSPFFHKAGMKLLFPGQQRLLRELVGLLQKKKSILFMDRTTLKATAEHLQLSIPDPVFVPVPSDDARSNARLGNPRRPKERLEICWVGRLADFKIHILIYTLEQLREHAVRRRLPITVHVIGDGPEAHRLDRFSTAETFFQLRRIGTLPMRELETFLVESVDLVMAMGTSALEGARLGVPTVLLDMAYGRVPDGYKFRWLHQARDCNLAEVISDAEIARGNTTLADIIAAVLADFDGASRKTQAYYLSHHSISAVAEKFLTAAAQASFTSADFDPEVFSKGLLRKAFEAVRDRRSVVRDR